VDDSKAVAAMAVAPVDVANTVHIPLPPISVTTTAPLSPSTSSNVATTTTPTPTPVRQVSLTRDEWISLVRSFLHQREVTSSLSAIVPLLSGLGSCRNSEESLSILKNAMSSSTVVINHPFVIRMAAILTDTSNSYTKSQKDAIINAGVEIARVLSSLITVLPLFAQQPNALPYMEQLDRLYNSIMLPSLSPAPVTVATAPAAAATSAVSVASAVPTKSTPATALSSAPSPAAASSASSSQVVHVGIHCDACKAMPIVGVRYKCTICHDYDNCERCESSGAHTPSHAMMKIKTPVTIASTSSNTVTVSLDTPKRSQVVVAPPLPEAEFVW
jgi:hypothetical protein